MTELIAVEEASDGVRYVTLNRPEKKNAISTPMRAELFAVLQAHDHDDDVRVSVLGELVTASRLATTCRRRSWMRRPTIPPPVTERGLAKPPMVGSRSGILPNR